MAKRNNNKKAKAQTKTYGQPALSRRGPSSKQAKSRGRKEIGKMAACMQVCAGVDPFCPGAVGTKLRDNNSRSTMPYTQRLTFPVTANSNGYALYQISARGNACAIPVTVNSLGVGTSYGTGIEPSDQTQIESSFTGYRVVSAGVRVVCTANVTESKGFVTFATVPNSLNATPGLASTDGTTYPEYERYSLAGLDATWVSKPNGTESHDFVAFSEYSEDTKLILGFSGCAATTVVAQVEVIIHLELVAKVGDFAARMTTPPAKADPRLVAAQQHVRRQVPSAAQGTVAVRSKSFVDTAMQVLNTIDTVAPYVSEVAGLFL